MAPIIEPVLRGLRSMVCQCASAAVSGDGADGLVCAQVQYRCRCWGERGGEHCPGSDTGQPASALYPSAGIQVESLGVSESLSSEGS